MSLLPPPCEEFTTSEPLRKSDAGQAAGDERDFFTHQDVGTQIDVARFDFAVDQAGCAGERKGGLRDVVARIGQNARAKIVALQSAELCGPMSMP